MQRTEGEKMKEKNLFERSGNDPQRRKTKTEGLNQAGNDKI